MAIDVNVQKRWEIFSSTSPFLRRRRRRALGCVGLREEQDTAMYCRY